jgi:hypothetical protein
VYGKHNSKNRYQPCRPLRQGASPCPTQENHSSQPSSQPSGGHVATCPYSARNTETQPSTQRQGASPCPTKIAPQKTNSQPCRPQRQGASPCLLTHLLLLTPYQVIEDRLPPVRIGGQFENSNLKKTFERPRSAVGKKLKQIRRLFRWLNSELLPRADNQPG